MPKKRAATGHSDLACRKDVIGNNGSGKMHKLRPRDGLPSGLASVNELQSTNKPAKPGRVCT
ncbi:hypothetical protein YDYSY3_28780 [Paenibacillus chitinolyticus]|nr:hypothetical protein YDYSY3_28780 [Paenibacillus chitinolyticus]